MNYKKTIWQSQTTRLRELIRIVNRRSKQPRVLPRDNRQIRLFCMLFFWNHHALYDYGTGFLAAILGSIYMLFSRKSSPVMDRMAQYWWMPILWVALIAIFILILWLARRSLVKETLFLLEHAKDEIARQYEEGNGVVSQEVINLENYVDDLQRNYRF